MRSLDLKTEKQVSQPFRTVPLLNGHRRFLRLARKRYSDEDALQVLREIDVHLHDGLDVVSSCCKAGISDKSYLHWRKKFGGIGRSRLS